MKFSLFLLVKCIFIYNCACLRNDKELEADCDQNKVIKNDTYGLILIRNGNNLGLINEFQKNIKDIPVNITIVKELCPGGVIGTIEALKLYPNADILNLEVNDFYQFNYNYILSNGLNYAGEIGNSIETVKSYVIDMKGKYQYAENIEMKNQTLRSVKLFSTRENVDADVYNYIYSFQHDTDQPTYPVMTRTVLICFDDYILNEDQIVSLIDLRNLKLEFTRDCKRDMEKLEHDILAVITHEPIEMDAEVPIPIVLYTSPLTHLKTYPYEKIITLTSANPYELLKLALMRLMKKVGWQRIAILSDNYDPSAEFERSLVSIFDKEDVMYTVFQCEENVKGSYNFLEILNTLERADARIILLNMNDQNVKKLFEKIYTNHRHLYYNCVWILRDGIRDTDAQNMGNVLSINLTPAISRNSISNRVNSFHQSIVNKFKIKSILESIFRVQEAYEHMLTSYDDANNQLFYEYRTLYKLLSKYSAKHTQVYVKYQIRNNEPEILASILFDETRIAREEYSLPDFIPPDMHECALRSNNFFKPCNYLELIYLMFVLVVFIPTLFTVVIFFSDKHIIHGRRHYSNL